VKSTAQFLSPSEAASQLGVSIKALRLYEQRGLIAPGRTLAGWRTYGPTELRRAADIVEMRALGLSFEQIARVIEGDARTFDKTLAAHKASLEDRIRHLGNVLGQVSRLRAGLGRGEVTAAREGSRPRAPDVSVAFNLPWPWGGERFELRDIRPLTYIVGPLGSGKTQLAKCVAASLPGAVFVGLDRLANGAAAALAALALDPALKSRVDANLAAIVDDGGKESAALLVLLAALQSDNHSVLVVDMLEHGLDAATQGALIANLRRRGPSARPLFFLTRSSAILDMDCVGTNEAIIFCSANHSPPRYVAPYPGTPGYEGVATCLASPEVRARTEGMTAQLPTPS